MHQRLHSLMDASSERHVELTWELCFAVMDQRLHSLMDASSERHVELTWKLCFAAFVYDHDVVPVIRQL
jgi:hypothetical protein